MSVAFGSGFTVISSTWTNFLSVVTSKKLLMQYTDDSTITTVFAFDGPIVYSAIMWDGTVPDGVIAGGYSQTQNNSDLSTFQTTYQSSANARIQRTDQFGNPIETPFQNAAMLGLLPGALTGRAQGYTGTNSTGGKAIRATTYTPQGTNSQRSISSTNAADTAAGTGAQTVTINYLDTSFASHSETVTLNGTTAVNTVGTNIAFIESMAVATVGSGGGNVGTIQIFTATAGGGSVWGSIAPSDNQTFWAHHYVPSGVTCYILSITAGATVAAGQTNINHTGNPLSTNVPQQQIGVTIMHVAAGTWDHEFEIPLGVPGPDFIFLVERPVVATTSTAVAGFEYMQF
jgi:hypothetical protein